MPKQHTNRIRCLVAVWSCLLIASCQNASITNETPSTSGSGEQAQMEQSKGGQARQITVSVAASTKEVLERLATAFMDKTKATVKINPGSSNNLANQIVEGAPVDLFLSASREWASKISDEGLGQSSKELLTNKLVIIVPKGNPLNIKDPIDLSSDRVQKIALAGETVPAGKYADQALTKLELLDQLTAAGKIARAQDVRGALNFVARGEAEAGIVYSTDAHASKDVETIYEFEPTLHDEIVYVLVLLKHGSGNPVATEFYDYLQSDAATKVYEESGFTRRD